MYKWKPCLAVVSASFGNRIGKALAAQAMTIITVTAQLPSEAAIRTNGHEPGMLSMTEEVFSS